jgi:hypothetical protein
MIRSSEIGTHGDRDSNCRPYCHDLEWRSARRSKEALKGMAVFYEIGFFQVEDLAPIAYDIRGENRKKCEPWKQRAGLHVEPGTDENLI